MAGKKAGSGTRGEASIFALDRDEARVVSLAQLRKERSPKSPKMKRVSRVTLTSLASKVFNQRVTLPKTPSPRSGPPVPPVSKVFFTFNCTGPVIGYLESLQVFDLS